MDVKRIMSRALITTCYYLHSMKKRTKKKSSITAALYAALEHKRHPQFHLANRILGIVTLISVLAVVLETVAFFEPYQLWLTILEYAAVVIFTIEYIVRLVETKPRRSYVFGFFGIIDLVAIVPTILGLGNFTFLKAARSVRTIRLLRIARLAKVARFNDEKAGSKAVLGINFEIYFLALVMVLTLLGSMLYLFESNQSAAADIPSGILWASKVILGGLSTPQPETFGGAFTLILTRFSAMILFGFIVGLVGAVLRRTLIGADKDL